MVPRAEGFLCRYHLNPPSVRESLWYKVYDRRISTKGVWCYARKEYGDVLGRYLLCELPKTHHTLHLIAAYHNVSTTLPQSLYHHTTLSVLAPSYHTTASVSGSLWCYAERG
eukprot:2785665-Rhodomonas_salina.1